jgi:hypothetical protein
MKDTLDYSDLTEFDRNMIRHIAQELYLNKRDQVPSDNIMEAVFQCIANKSMKIVKDESKTPTWPVPKSGWYNPQYKTRKGWW